MAVIEKEAKTILRKYKRIDSWFISRYGMNLYRGCLHDCVYCDGRAEKYQVEGDFGSDIVVKTNAIDILKKELNPHRRRIPLIKGFMILGGGVGDSYQPVEKTYKLAHKTLELLYQHHWPVHILTKSTSILNDLELIQKINEDTKSLISFSFSSTNDKISTIFEPGVPPPSERLKTISKLSNNGVDCGMFLMPIIPFISDKKDTLEQTFKDAQKAGVQYIVYGGMTLKEGRQKQHFYQILKNNYPELLVEYQHIYKIDKWGQAIPQYYQSLSAPLLFLSKKYKIPLRIPNKLFKDNIPENDLVVVILDQINYLLRLRGQRSPSGYAASQISKITTPFSQINHSLRELKGVGATSERIITEILRTGTSSYYESLLYQ